MICWPRHGLASSVPGHGAWRWAPGADVQADPMPPDPPRGHGPLRPEPPGVDPGPGGAGGGGGLLSGRENLAEAQLKRVRCELPASGREPRRPVWAPGAPSAAGPRSGSGTLQRRPEPTPPATCHSGSCPAAAGPAAPSAAPRPRALSFPPADGKGTAVSSFSGKAQQNRGAGALAPATDPLSREISVCF